MKYIMIQSWFICLQVGQLKISEMRQRAETELKEKFDIKDFHEVTHWFSFPGSFPKYILTLSDCCQFPKCYLSGDFGVSGAPLFG